MDKKKLTEADIRSKFVLPGILGTNGEKWNLMTQVREEVYFTKGRVIVRGKTVKRGEANKEDYLLYFKTNMSISVVEVKEHPYPPGVKSYNRRNPIRIEEFEVERKWWGKPDKKGRYSKRQESELAWRVSIDQIKAGNFNLDLKNPHQSDEGPGDVDHLLPEYEKLLAQIAETRAKLKAQLMEALQR